MKLRPQVQLRFRDAEQFLAVKERAAFHGISVNEFILRKIEHKAPNLRGEGVMPSDAQQRMSVPEVHRSEHAVAGEHRAETSADKNDCPDCGEALVWNKVLKRWVCECGWQGKKNA